MPAEDLPPDHGDHSGKFELGIPMEVRFLPPGQIVHLPPEAFAVDIETHQIYVAPQWEITHDDEASPSSIPYQRVGLMRVYEQEGDEAVDGFVADFRYVNPAEVPQLEFTEVKPGSDSTTVGIHDPATGEYSLNEASSSFLAVAYRENDEDQIDQGDGDGRFVDRLRYLMDEVDRMVDQASGLKPIPPPM